MASWTVIANMKRSVVSVQTTTDSAPSASTDGMGFQSVAGFRVFLDADSGQTLSGAGTLAAYGWDDALGHWSRASDFDIAIPLAVAGNRSYGPIAFQVSAPRGRMAFIASGVTVSSGGCTIWMIANDLYGNEV